MRHKRKRQMICLGLSFILLLAGCRSSEGTVPPQGDAAEKVTIKWMVFGEKSKSSDSVIAEFNQKLQEYFPDTTVEFEIVPIQSYKEKWDMKMAANEELDLVWIGNDLFNYTEEVKKGGFMALDYLLSANGNVLLDEIEPELWEKQKRDGKIYSVPLMGALYRKDYALVVNKHNLENYGNKDEIARIMQEKQYTDEECYLVLESYLENLKTAQKLGTGVSCDTFRMLAEKGYESIYGPKCPFVIKIFDEQLKVYNKYELDSYKYYFKTMQEWYQKGYIRSDIEEVLAPELDNGSKTGNAVFLDEYGESGVVLDQIATEYEAERIPLQSYKYISYEAARNAIAIPRTTTNPKRAMEILNLLNSKEGEEFCRLLCNGFEGRHYVKKGANQIDRVTDENGKSLYSLSPYAVGNVFLNFENTKDEFKQLKEYNKEAVVSGLQGFELDTRMIILEMAKIDLVVEEYIDSLERGTQKDWELAYEEMIGKMKEAGSEKVIAEMQKQIDKYQAGKDTNVK